MLTNSNAQHNHKYVGNSLAPGTFSACENSTPFPDLLRFSYDPASLSGYPLHPAFELREAESGSAALPTGAARAAASHPPVQWSIQPCLAPPAATLLPLHITWHAQVTENSRHVVLK